MLGELHIGASTNLPGSMAAVVSSVGAVQVRDIGGLRATPQDRPQTQTVENLFKTHSVPQVITKQPLLGLSKPMGRLLDY